MRKKIIVSLILLVIICVNISYALSVPNEESFFEVNKTELEIGEILEMTVDLSKIEYTKFKIVLNSNEKIEEIYTDENESDIQLQKEVNDIIIEIDKDKLNLDKITLYYQIPVNMQINMKLQLKAQIKIEDDENEEKMIDEKQVEITIIENKNSENDSNESKEEEKNNNNEKNNIIEKDNNKDLEEKNNNIEDSENKEPLNENKNKSEDINISELTNKTNTSSNKTVIQSSSNTQTETYNGSCNNYLSSIKIENVELNTDFNKEKTTYFATVEGVEKVTITAIAEDSNSIVAITGTDLKSGENKILISVTAENGNVRYYRIYITNT